MKFEEYRQYDAVGLAQLVARKEITPAELLDLARARAAEVNPVLNAIILDLSDEAHAAIADGLPDGPLAGVPYPIKDITVQMKNAVTGAGSRLFAAGPRAAQDSEMIRRLRAAGLTLFAKTNTPELGLAAVTEPVANAPTLNPWNLEVTCGGSSGGAAAAVAAGIVPAAHASDGGGSIRIPAACCGLVGLKPSRGRVSSAPGFEGWGGLTVQHAVTRSVRDSAMLLDVTAGRMPGDLYYVPPPDRPFVEEVGRDPGRLRIGVSTQALTYGALHPECVTAVENAARLCTALGHDVEPLTIDADFTAMAIAANVLVSASVAGTLEAEAERRGSPIREDEVEALTWRIYQDARERDIHETALAQVTINTFSRQLATSLAPYDVVILSTLGHPPRQLGYLSPSAPDLTDYAERLYSFIPNTQTFNVGGQPAVSLPLHWTPDNLPVGVMFVGPWGGESVLLRLAGQIEGAAQWFDHVPAELPSRRQGVTR